MTVSRATFYVRADMDDFAVSRVDLRQMYWCGASAPAKSVIFEKWKPFFQNDYASPIT
jgi:hypothetical protein